MKNEQKNLVKEVCEKLNISQVELAKMLELPVYTITGWVRGQSPDIAKVILKLLVENREKDKIITHLKELKKLISD